MSLFCLKANFLYFKTLWMKLNVERWWSITCNQDMATVLIFVLYGVMVEVTVMHPISNLIMMSNFHIVTVILTWQEMLTWYNFGNISTLISFSLENSKSESSFSRVQFTCCSQTAALLFVRVPPYQLASIYLPWTLYFHTHPFTHSIQFLYVTAWQHWDLRQLIDVQQRRRFCERWDKIENLIDFCKDICLSWLNLKRGLNAK